MLTSLQIVIISLCFLVLALILGILIYLIKNHNKKEYTCTTENCPSPSSCLSNVCTPPYNNYQIIDNLSGNDLMPSTTNNTSAMVYYVTDNDPTQGYVNYGAWDDLIDVNNATGKFIVKAGNVKGGKRKMIRMYSRKAYNDGLFVIKADHIPEGNGVWPAFWLTSKTNTWACGGEIDIIEGVNSISSDPNSSRNNSTLHTNDGSGVCQQKGVKNISDPNCSSVGNSKIDYTCGCNRNEKCPYGGCGVKLDSQYSFGYGFNINGGGIYATELTTDGFISIWFFPKGTEPEDLKDPNGTPDPSSWQTSDNVIKFNQCKGNFKNLEMVLNTDLCGTWAGNKFVNGDTKGISACQNYIDTQDLSKAYWSIDYIKVFQKPANHSPEPSTCKCPDGTFCDSGICTNNSPGCYENDEDVFGDKCKKGVKCCDNSTFCRNKIGKYKYYCHKGNTCIPGDSKVDPDSSIFPPCPTGNCNVPDSKLCKPK